MIILCKVDLVHKSDVYFDVVKTKIRRPEPFERNEKQLHHGEIYIYLNQIYLYDNKRWFKANIEDIKNIETLLRRKQILIHFLNYDMVLFCKKNSHLMALRDFLKLSHNYFLSNNIIPSKSKVLSGGNGH